MLLKTLNFHFKTISEHRILSPEIVFDYSADDVIFCYQHKLCLTYIHGVEYWGNILLFKNSALCLYVKSWDSGFGP